MNKKKVVSVTFFMWLLLILFYHNIFILLDSYAFSKIINMKEPTKKEKAAKQSQLPHYNGTEDYLINTTGCYIPNYSKTIIFKETNKAIKTCPVRVVSVEKTSDHEVMFKINKSKIYSQHKKENLMCCYRFVIRETDDKIRYTTCVHFKNGDKAPLNEEIITVSCNLTSRKYAHILWTYSDAYLILKNKFTRHNSSENDVNSTLSEKWNVLVIGMDTMSRARAYNSIPKTVKYLLKHKWLDYRAYQKTGLNTFPNVMSILTGKNDSVYSKCSYIDNCKDDLIWSRFKGRGYVTAFGEENLRLPDTFHPYHGFKDPPTDHYTRPFFLLGEKFFGNTVCLGNKPSGQHLLEYSLQFAEAYKNDGFFGFFWINSFSHNLENLPALFEDPLIRLFESLRRSGVLENTFVFFLSDHGIRFGPLKINVESYYEERLPMLFMWVPPRFQKQHPQEYYNLQVNQHRFTTHYDLHATLCNILQISDSAKSFDTIVPPEACPQCKGLTEEIPLDRTCTAAGIALRWCTCHNLETAVNDTAVTRSLEIGISYIQNRSHAVETKKCTSCIPLKFNHLIRSHKFTEENRAYYVLAFSFKPTGLAYEMTIEHEGDNFKVLQSTDTISKVYSTSMCVVKKSQRAYCICTKKKKCK